MNNLCINKIHSKEFLWMRVGLCVLVLVSFLSLRAFADEKPKTIKFKLPKIREKAVLTFL